MRGRLRQFVKVQQARAIRYALRRSKPRHTHLSPDAPISIAGLFRSGGGIGALARSTYQSFRACGIAPSAHDLTASFLPCDLDAAIPFVRTLPERPGTLIVHLNAPELPMGLYRLGLRAHHDWRVIGYWAWELPGFPEGWERSFEVLSEIWTLSDFAAQSLRQHPAAPVVYSLPIAVTPSVVRSNRSRFNLPEGVFVALTAADALSSFDRKNPIGAIEAFRSAFGERDDCLLIVKTRNIGMMQLAARAISAAIGGARNIRHIDETLSATDFWMLLASVDCLLSLHRAEGFGIVPAEAMALGKPVIATGWSGNLSFMNKDCSFLTRYRLQPVQDRFGIYAMPEVQWAEPDIAHAAELLRKVRTDPDSRERIGAAARLQIATTCSPQAVGRRMMSLLRLPAGEEQEEPRLDR
jgi:glycosyltransferase involved in cell wall biosynthesis